MVVSTDSQSVWHWASLQQYYHQVILLTALLSHSIAVDSSRDFPSSQIRLHCWIFTFLMLSYYYHSIKDDSEWKYSNTVHKQQNRKYFRVEYRYQFTLTNNTVSYPVFRLPGLKKIFQAEGQLEPCGFIDGPANFNSWRRLKNKSVMSPLNFQEALHRHFWKTVIRYFVWK